MTNVLTMAGDDCSRRRQLCTSRLWGVLLLSVASRTAVQLGTVCVEACVLEKMGRVFFGIIMICSAPENWGLCTWCRPVLC